MIKNIGTLDKIVRVILGILIIAYGVVSESLLGLIGLIPLVTAAISWCPLYPLVGISTCEKKED